ncbi:hypothetical protein ACFE04_005309 [Oxalis oulophora]
MAASLTFSLKPLSKIPTRIPTIFNLSTRNLKPHKPNLTNLSISFPFTKTLMSPIRPKIPTRTQTQTRYLFTGIVEEMGTVKTLTTVENDGYQMTITGSTVLEGVNLGDIIAVNETCLTVPEFDTLLGGFKVGLSPETLRKTSLIEFKVILLGMVSMEICFWG